MGMQVNKTRSDEFPFGVNQLGTTIRWNIGCKPRDPRVLYPKVAAGPQILARVKNFSALNDEVKFISDPDTLFGGPVSANAKEYSPSGSSLKKSTSRHFASGFSFFW